MHANATALSPPTDPNQIISYLGDLKDLLIAINNNLSVVIGQTSINTSDIATAGTTLQNHDNGLTALDSLMIKVQANILKIAGTTPVTSSSSSSSSRKVPKLATPDKFDGTDKNKAVSFRVAVSHYLWVSYPGSTVDEKIAFIISCLDGKAHKWLEPYLEDNVVNSKPVGWLHDIDDFWAQFNACWNVQNKTENFRAKLRALKQTKSVQEYFKDFQTFSQNLGYNNISLRDMFYDNLSLKIKEMLMAQDYDHMDSSVTLEALAAKALKIDQRLEQFQAQNKGQSSSGGTSSKSNPSTSSTAPETAWVKLVAGDKVFRVVDGKAQKGEIKSLTRKNGQTMATVKWNSGDSNELDIREIKKDDHPVVAPKPSTPKNSGPQPMDLDSTGKGKKLIICNTCGGRGHYASQCPSKPLSGQAATMSDSEDEESEKEDL